VTLVVGAILVAALALFIDWLARLMELVAAPKGV
jgi:osmoprotectant transport system permease protein